jgi:hypothetical protein
MFQYGRYSAHLFAGKSRVSFGTLQPLVIRKALSETYKTGLRHILIGRMRYLPQNTRSVRPTGTTYSPQSHYYIVLFCLVTFGVRCFRSCAESKTKLIARSIRGLRDGNLCVLS